MPWNVCIQLGKGHCRQCGVVSCFLVAYQLYSELFAWETNAAAIFEAMRRMAIVFEEDVGADAVEFSV